ncbi:MAG: glycoside hydrolase domain-containing protein [Isosphaeraceae bacterium]
MRSRVVPLVVLVFLAGVWVKAAVPPDRPPWQGNHAGVSDAVLPPWTPVAVAGNQANVWGRSYRFGTPALPVSVITRGAEMLAGPITLVAETSRGSRNWMTMVSRAGEVRPDHAQFVNTCRSADFQCESTATVEYDGMVRCNLRLISVSGKVSIERLSLEIPLVADHATFVHTWPGQWGSAGNSKALPAQGFQSPFKPFVWLGDHERGLSWFTESDRNMHVRDAAKAIEIERSDRKVILRVNLITAPREVSAPLEYTFGFEATPVKPARPDAWDYRIVHSGHYGMTDPELDRLAQAGVRTICFHEHWTDIQNYPETTHGQELDKLVAACHQRGIQLLLYFGYELSDIAPEWDRYHEECLVAPRAGGYKRQPAQTAYIVCYRSHWQDFLAQGIDRVMTKHGIDGVYLDGTSEPWGCANRRHGCGYDKPDGSVGTTYPIFATRQMMKRIATIVHQHNPKGQVNVHQSTCMTIPTLGFATSYWDGEQLQSLKRKSTSALEILPLDAFCAEFMGHNWGVPAELLWYGSGPFRRVEAMSLGLLHDIPVRPVSDAEIQTSGKLWKTFDAFGRHEADWIPYWKSAQFARTSPASVKVSLYNRPGQGLITVVVNAGDRPCEAEVGLDLAALEQKPNLTARDVLKGSAVKMTEGKLSLLVGPMEYRVVWLKTP